MQEIHFYDRQFHLKIKVHNKNLAYRNWYPNYSQNRVPIEQGTPLICLSSVKLLLFPVWKGIQAIKTWIDNTVH